MIQDAIVSSFKRIASIMAPPKQMTISEWADTYRQLSSEASSEPGQWDTSRAEYQRKMMDCLNDSNVNEVVIMTSSQIGKTEILLNTLGYYIDYDPSPIMLIQPTVVLAEAFSTDRLAPMIRDTKCLTSKVITQKQKVNSGTILHKSFPGGHITLAGANSAASLASRPIRVLLCDEVDRYPKSAGKEGDPLKLADKRTTTFWNKKRIYVSTPTLKGASTIDREYNSSTMGEWNIKCPSCKELQPYEWERINYDWERINFNPVTMTCRSCGAVHTEFEWKAEDGEWLEAFPERKKVGFHLNELASPWRRWKEIVEDFENAKNNTETLKVWVNTSLGLPWEDRGDSADEEKLFNRREKYGCEVPDDVLVLTAGVDTQDDRFEVEVVGWGKGFESWGIQYQVIRGDMHQPLVWKELDDFLSTEFRKPNGQKLKISCTCIDSGGHLTQEVYKFTKTREARRIYAIKGQGGESVPFINRVTRTSRENNPLFSIGVDAGKQTIIANLKLEAFGEGFCHFPIEESKGYNFNYFLGLTSETLVISIVNGTAKAKWIKRVGVRNEPFDVRNYALAAIKILNPNFEKLKNDTIKPKEKKTVKRRTSKGVEL